MAEFLTYKPVETPTVTFDYDVAVPEFNTVSFEPMAATTWSNPWRKTNAVEAPETEKKLPQPAAEPIEPPKTEVKVEAPVKTLPKAKSKPSGKKLSKAEFKAKHWDRAVRVANDLGIDPNAILAQAYVESGGVEGNPMFGIKAGKGWAGKSKSYNTREVINGQDIRINDSFRVYDSDDEAFDDYGKFIQGKRYRGALGLPTDQYFNYIHKAGYATDPNYAKTMTSVAGQFARI